MIVERIEVENFRSIMSASLECNNLTAILGRNGCGKSTLLKALSVFYDVAYQATPYDYFARDVAAQIQIRVTYADLRQDELAEFDAYVSNGRLTVKKTINAGGAKYYAAARQIARFVELRRLGAMDRRRELNQLIDSGTLPDLGPRVANDAQAQQMMDAYELAHPELTAPFDREQQFFGPRNIGGGKLDKFTKFVLIPAVRDATSETDRKGIINQLIDVLVARSVNARPDVRELNAQFEVRVKQVYSKDNLTELSTLAQTISKILIQYAPNALLDLEFEEITPPKIALPGALASLVEDNFSSPIGYSGHGVQRALILALLQQLSLTDLSPPLPQEQAQPNPAPQGPAVPALPPAARDADNVARAADLILAIEEPELYLHPSRARYLSTVLQKLTQPADDELIPHTQVLYCTHSPYFVDLAQFNCIRLARKVVMPPIATPQCTLKAFSLRDAATRLAHVSGQAIESITADSFLAHVSPVMTSIVNEGFFGDVVVVVEGIGDMGLLWGIQEQMRMAWDQKNITVVPAMGKNNIDRPTVVFTGLQIPTYFVFDADEQLAGAKRDQAQQKNIELQRLAGVPAPVSFPPTQVCPTWAVFGQKVETEIRTAIGDQNYSRILQDVAGDLGYDDPAAILKNHIGAAEFIRRTYDSGLRVPVLETLVETITALHH